MHLHRASSLIDRLFSPALLCYCSLSEPADTLLFEVRNEHNKGIGKPNFMGIASVKNVLGLPMNVVHDISLPLLPRENKPTDSVSGVLNVRVLVSTSHVRDHRRVFGWRGGEKGAMGRCGGGGGGRIQEVRRVARADRAR